MGTTDENGELRRTAPTLFGIPKMDPFLVPNGFFERFPHQVADGAKAPDRGNVWSWPRRLGIALPAMAVVCLLAWWAARPVHNTLPTPEIPQLSLAEFEAYTSYTDLPAPTVEELRAIPPMDSVGIQLTDEELLAYIDYEQLSLHEVINTIQ